jgi:hypothetical protein
VVVQKAKLATPVLLTTKIMTDIGKLNKWFAKIWDGKAHNANPNTPADKQETMMIS